ncbi:hypothetical protein D3C74_129590 [compost metagenome]
MLQIPSLLLNSFICTITKKWNMPLEDIALISVIDMLNLWMPLLAKQVEWSQQKEWHNNHIKDFQKGRTWYMSIGDVSDQWSSLRACDYGEFMIARFQPRRKKLKQYKESLVQKKEENMRGRTFIGYYGKFYSYASEKITRHGSNEGGENNVTIKPRSLSSEPCLEVHKANE